MIGVVVYVLVDCVLQVLPPHYDPIREAESNLAVGPYGWIMNLNFLGRAATTLCAVNALRRLGSPSQLRLAGLILLVCGGAASAVLAFFATDVDVVPGSAADSYTVTGIVHLIVAGAGFIAALGAVVVLTVWLRRTRALRIPLPAGPAAGRTNTPATTLATAFAVLTVGGGLWLAAAATVAPGTLGIAERVCLVGILGWTFVVCAGIRQRDARPRAERQLPRVEFR